MASSGFYTCTRLSFTSSVAPIVIYTEIYTSQLVLDPHWVLTLAWRLVVLNWMVTLRQKCRETECT